MTTEYIMHSDLLWKNCPKRHKLFLFAEVFVIVSIFVYALAFLFGFTLLWCCSAFRWVCVTLNVIGIGTLCVVWVMMLKAYHMNSGAGCLVLDQLFHFGIGFTLLLVAWVLDILAIFFLLLPLEAKKNSGSTKTDEMDETDKTDEGQTSCEGDAPHEDGKYVEQE
ncbi:uncharacterized protein [Leishmania mexicana MHOM/GT/2001/U1103]|uniref:Amastin-like protein n=1 Tax=Leishmania mexicana (strain MHOM/GT/2001/U1103) TaxID=929439 RepID=E9AMF7_LEIMU|nr:uncharacterized protein [Leishmania mexicana MHOM/GT/2001/U1103]CBZ24112.1 unnamed protein product [Leishmania mexicana MHOM/GT/2001/U1103]